MTGAESRRTDIARRFVRAPAASIYRALVDAAAVARWLPPAGMTGQVHAFDPRPGGAYRMSLTYRAEDGVQRGKTSAQTDMVSGRFLELVPDRRVVQTVEFESDDPAFAGVMTMRWDIEPEPGGATVTITAINVPPGVRPEDHDAGMRSTLENLAAFVE